MVHNNTLCVFVADCVFLDSDSTFVLCKKLQGLDEGKRSVDSDFLFLQNIVLIKERKSPKTC